MEKVVGEGISVGLASGMDKIDCMGVGVGWVMGMVLGVGGGEKVDVGVGSAVEMELSMVMNEIVDEAVGVELGIGFDEVVGEGVGVGSAVGVELGVGIDDVVGDDVGPLAVQVVRPDGRPVLDDVVVVLQLVPRLRVVVLQGDGVEVDAALVLLVLVPVLLQQLLPLPLHLLVLLDRRPPGLLLLVPV